MDADAIIRLRLEMEFGVAPVGDTLPWATTNQDGQPRLLVSEHREGPAFFFRHDVPPAQRQQLQALGADIALTDAAVVDAILHDVSHIWRVRWYTIDVEPPPDAFPDVVNLDGRYFIMDGDIVAAQAWTTAQSARATEVEVETHPDYRRRGYAAQVVSAWAAAHVGDGRLAFYSHVEDNVASAGVARRLGLTWLSTEVEYQ